MSNFTEAHNQCLIEACSQNAGTIAAAFGRCFDSPFQAVPGESRPFDLQQLPEVCDGPGLVLSFQVGDQGLMALVPAALPLPEWHAQPSEDEAIRLQTLADECAPVVLPEDLEAQQCAAAPTPILKSMLETVRPSESSTIFELCFEVQPDDGGKADPSTDSPAASTETQPGDSEPDAGETDSESASKAAEAETAAEGAGAAPGPVSIYFVWPINTPTGASDSVAEPPPVLEAAVPEAHLAGAGQPHLPSSTRKLGRLRGLPVSVIVRLAEKKIELGQLLSLSPGALITFNKPCEDLLDLYVNNHLYCRGEAVKIGEKFGLKVNDVGVVPVRQKPVIQG